MDEIAEFTELGDYLAMPMHTYSAGMRLRLAFAVCTCFEPEILLMDEWLSVGDRAFVEKAKAPVGRIRGSRRDSGARLAKCKSAEAHVRPRGLFWMPGRSRPADRLVRCCAKYRQAAYRIRDFRPVFTYPPRPSIVGCRIRSVRKRTTYISISSHGTLGHEWRQRR